MTTVEVPFRQILSVTEKLSRREREKLAARLREIEEREARVEREKQLVREIAGCKLSRAQKSRSIELRAKLESETASPAELEEIESLAALAEELTALRLEKIAELAQVRGVEPRKLLNEFSTKKGRP